jgi:two-component system cell cycle sensor histidine kinase/response regulator CckA
VRNCRLFSRTASVAAVLVGSLALLGWLLGIPALTSILPGLAHMKPDSAICIVLAGVSLWLIQLRAGELSNPRVRQIHAAQVLSGVVALTGLLILVEHLFRMNLGIDELFFRSALDATAALHPVRMSSAAAMGFLLLGSSVLFMSHSMPYPAQSLALLTSLNGFVACVGYLIGASALYDVPAYSSMAMHTAILFAVLGIGVLVAQPRLGVMTAVTSECIGGVMARRVLPLGIVVPVFFGWIRWRGQHGSFYGTEFGTALETLGEVVTLVILLWLSAVWLNRLDQERREVAQRNFRLAAIVESSEDAIFSKDLSGTIISWNHGAERLYGYSAAEIIGKPIATIIPPELQGEAKQFLTEIAKGQLVTREETVRRRKDGRLVNVSLIISPVGDFDGQIVGASTIAHDITERKQTEEALRESQQRLTSIITSAMDSIIAVDERQRIVLFNAAAQTMFRCSEAEALGQPIERFIPERFRSAHRAHMRQFGETDVTNRAVGGLGSPWAVRANSEEFQIEASISQVESGGKTLYTVILRDVTERRQAEQLLRRSEENYRTLFESMDEGFCTIEVLFNENNKPVDYRFLEVNPAFEEQTGISDARGRRMREIAPLHEEHWFAIYGKIALTGEPARFENEAAQLHRWYDVHAFRVGEPQDRKVAIFFDDITDRKHAEEALREQAKVMDSAQVFVRDMQSRVVFWPRGAQKMYGYKPEEALGVVSHDLFNTQFPEPLEVIEKKLFETGTWEGELIHQTRDGRTIVVSSSWVLHRDSQGRPVRILETNVDITSRKQAEGELRESEERMRLFIEYAPAELAMFDREMHYLHISRRWRTDFSLGDRDLRGVSHYEVFPEVPERWKEAHRRGLAGEILRGDNDRFERADGSVQWIRWEIRPWHDRTGKIGGIVIFTEDITERNRAEERLREYERVVEGLEDMIVVLDRQYQFVIANRAYLNYRDVKIEEITGRPVAEVVGKEIFETTMKEKMEECFQGQVVRYQMQFNYPKIGERDVSVSFFPIAGPLGVTRLAAIIRDITERKRSEEALRSSEERFSKAFRSSPVAITISTQAEGRYLDVNDAFLVMIGCQRAEVIGRTAEDLNFWAEKSQRVEMLRQLRESGRVTGLRTQNKTSKGETREADVSAELIELGGQTCVLAITRDITETLKLEAQFRQAQKMEAVGRLAGGVAHDFNNMLGVIIGYSDLSLGLIAPESPANRYIDQIKKASHRAGGLTRQLLAFSRQQVVFPKILDLNEVVHNVTTMLQRLIGEDVAMSFRPTVPLGSINADPGQIEQILMNLVVNARDAMPGGGEIIIETGHAELDEHYVFQHPGSHAGPHVVLSVSDTGCGMDEKIKAQIFEPFFTTKGIGEGTGLGLSTVYGIVKQGGGTIFVYSEPGKGTTFKIYLPRVEGKAEQLAQSHREADFSGGSETILVVEDDFPLRELTVSMLKAAGYRVIEASNAEAALEILKASEPGIDLLITDVIMPGKSGVELLDLAKAIRPSLRSLFVSGYTGDLVALRGGLVPEAAFLEKPFTRSSLLQKVRSALRLDV